jgi:hypothetical protein
MKDTKRALRRRHRQRMIARAMKSFRLAHIPQENSLQWARRLYNNLQFCSCWMCGHRRKWWGLTIQERRQLHAEELDTGNELFCEAEISDVAFDSVPEEGAWSRVCRAYHWSKLRLCKRLFRHRAKPR